MRVCKRLRCKQTEVHAIPDKTAFPRRWILLEKVDVSRKEKSLMEGRKWVT